MSGVVNLFDVELEADEEDPEGYRASAARVGPLIGASALGLSVYELPPRQSICPYHYEYPEEEWLLVIDGAPVVRTPEGDRELRRGDVVCFPSGEDGAHAVRGPGRVLILSANRSPSIGVYPDSDKIGTRPGQPGNDWLDFPRAAAVDYWEGE